MTRHKSFGRPTGVSAEPITFDLHGETFTAIPQIQGTTLMNLMKANDPDIPAASAGLIMDFFPLVLEDESLERFNTLISSKDKIVPAETLAEIVGWLVEEYSGRPEEQRED